jgi:hypothetical protein
VQEIWQIPHPESVNIPGYKFTFKQRNKNRGGGIGFYILQEIPFKILPDLSPFVEKYFESLTIEIILNSKRTILTNIYRPPSPQNNITPNEQLSDFIDRIDNLTSELSNLNSPTFIFSDANLNLHNLSSNHLIELYLISLHCNGFIQTILKSTRIQGDSHSLIDHISTNASLGNINTGVIISDLSDHFINFLQLPTSNVSKQKHSLKPSHSFTSDNHQRFKLALSQLSWNDVINCTEPDSSFNTFWTIFKELFDIHFPLISTRLNRNIHKINPYMTAGLLISRRRKHSLYMNSINTPSAENISTYKKYRNMYNTLVRLSRKMCYASSLFDCRKDPKKTWEILKEVITNNKSCSQITEIKSSNGI